MHIRQTLNATSRDAMKDELGQQRLRCNLVQEEFRECFRECPQNHMIRSLVDLLYLYQEWHTTQLPNTPTHAVNSL